MNNKTESSEDLIKYLINIWGKEISSDELQKIDSDKILKLINLLNDAGKKIKDKEDDFEKIILQKELELLKYISKDLWSVRSEKIIAALLGGDEINYSNLMANEIRIFHVINDIISSVSSVDIATYPLEEKIEDIIDKNIRVIKKDVDYRVLVANEDIQPFVGVDAIVYRGIWKGDVLAIPVQNYKLFKKTKITLLK